MTKMFKVRDITLEGPDLSGKTTLYGKLHSASGYRWNIQDRSEISMAIYAELYDRPDAPVWWEKVYRKIKDLNHRYVILLPDDELLLERYNQRGDEIQDESSLLVLAKKFREAASKLSKFPTCIIVNVDKGNQFSVAQRALGKLRDIEGYNTRDLCFEITRMAAASDGKEVQGMNFDLDLTGFEEFERSVLKYDKEEAYYKRITNKMLSTVKDEIEGKNEYSKKQDPSTTRRFIYTDDTCISYINVQVRNKKMTTWIVCRSSDVSKTFFYDLCFLQILSDEVRKILLKNTEICRSIISVRLDSAHIPEVD